MSPTLNGSSAIRRFERSDVIEIRDGITFDFYTGLPAHSLEKCFDPLDAAEKINYANDQLR